MDDKARGSIEGMLDNLLIKIARIKNVRWIEQEIPVSSVRDLALGNAIGEALARGYFLIVLGENRNPTKNDISEIFAMIKRRLPEIVEKIEKELHR